MSTRHLVDPDVLDFIDSFPMVALSDLLNPFTGDLVWRAGNSAFVGAGC